ncbi:hypothetical protein [Urbifossiella limnaea]|uniref:Uncharacterized protein n=1 Tax=Urbifossiella limnaea TaxID=2528023 RepID=A0A517Y2W5_9BACT|nr:hypothetical protein [Urbifossiella limnaea]QDU24048.1 hypothetical protein ETAA1_60590 [Urbifossiella limnaea]
MTAIAKTLVFLTLVAGVGAVVFATAVYTQRPGWFGDDVPEGAVPRGHVVMNFKTLARETDTQGKVAGAASALWGQRLKALQDAEDLRKSRKAEYVKLLAAARTAPNGFAELAEDPATGLLNVTTPGKAVIGPDGKNLAGADTLEAQIAKSIDRMTTDLTPKIVKHLVDVKRLQGEISDVQAKLTRQRTIREDLQNEAAYLGAARVNVAEQQGTAERRLKQLDLRLKTFGPQN